MPCIAEVIFGILVSIPETLRDPSRRPFHTLVRAAAQTGVDVAQPEHQALAPATDGGGNEAQPPPGVIQNRRPERECHASNFEARARFLLVA